MNKSEKEQLSVFLDAENDSDEAIQALHQDADLLNTWGRYHLISACMKDQCPDYIDTRLAAKVNRDLASEPTVLAPVKKSLPPVLKPLAGLALAASVATIAVLGVQQHRVNDAYTLTGPQPSIANNTGPLASQQIQTVNAGNQAAPLTRNQASTRMSSYLVNYNEYRTHAGMQGMLPYARLVTQQKDK